MRLESTAGQSPPVSFREALTRGLAPDGGLYLPPALPHVERDELERWRGLSFPDLAASIAQRWLADEFPDETIEARVRAAFTFPAPTVTVERGRHVLELFHGPTLAFKDFGARFLAQFLGLLLEERGGRATILVATSGDTGSAVAQGFYRVPRVRVVVLYPSGKISPFQEAQIATLGGNIVAVRVPGTFDDCQRLVKSALLDASLAALTLTSANSINIGRLLPQSFYYVAAYLAATGQPGQPVVFSVPSGNLGNLTAGVLARQAGLPVTRFIAATNVNDALPEYLATGVYRPRLARPTMSSAMDVGDPSNLPRLLRILGHSPAALGAVVWGTAISDTDTRACIQALHRRTSVVIDPHTAVAYAAADRYRQAHPGHEPIVVLATAHPAKFGDVMTQELGFAPDLPEPHRDWAGRPLHADEMSDSRYESFRALLLALPEDP